MALTVEQAKTRMIELFDEYVTGFKGLTRRERREFVRTKAEADTRFVLEMIDENSGSGGGSGVSDHDALSVGSLVWTNSGHTGPASSLASFDSGGSPTTRLASDFVTSASLAPVATSGSYTDLTGVPTVPGPASVLPQSLGTAAAGASGDFARGDHVHDMPSAADVGADPSGTASAAVGTHEAAADPHPIYALESSLAAVATSGSYSDLSGTPSLATVATTGAYSDLTGTPTLSAVATSGSASDLTTGTLAAARLPTTTVTPGNYTNADIVVDATGRITAASSGSSGGGSSVWDSYALPSGAPSLLTGSEEWMTTGVIGTWSTWDPMSVGDLTASFSDLGLLIETSTNSIPFRGVTTPVPSGAWEAWIYIGFVGGPSGFAFPSFLTLTGLTSTDEVTSHSWRLNNGIYDRFESLRWNNPNNSFSSLASAKVASPGNDMYLVVVQYDPNVGTGGTYAIWSGRDRRSLGYFGSFVGNAAWAPVTHLGIGCLRHPIRMIIPFIRIAQLTGSVTSKLPEFELAGAVS